MKESDEKTLEKFNEGYEELQNMPVKEITEEMKERISNYQIFKFHDMFA